MNRIKKYFKTRKQIRDMKKYTTIALYKLMSSCISIIDGKEEIINGVIKLIKSFNGMTNEEIQNCFYAELVRYIHETNPDNEVILPKDSKNE